MNFTRFRKNVNICLRIAERDVELPYSNHLLGRFWVYFYPLLMATFYFFVFTFLIGRRLQPGGSDESAGSASLTVFVSLIFWLYLSDTITRSISAYPAHSGLVKQLHFPFLTIPLSQPLASIPAFIPGFILSEILAFKVLGLVNIRSIPIHLLCVIITIFFALCLSPLLASVAIIIPDVREITSFIQALMPYLLPIFFSYSKLPQPLSQILSLNPLASLVLIVQEAFLHGRVNMYLLLSVIAFMVVTLLVSLKVHERVKDPLPDFV